MGAFTDDLLEIYFKQIRSIAEFGIPVWNSSLTGDDVVALERVQKTVLHVVMGEEYSSYNSALKVTGLKKLSERRKRLHLILQKRPIKTLSSLTSSNQTLKWVGELTSQNIALLWPGLADFKTLPLVT